MYEYINKKVEIGDVVMWTDLPYDNVYTKNLRINVPYLVVEVNTVYNTVKVIDEQGSITVFLGDIDRKTIKTLPGDQSKVGDTCMITISHSAVTDNPASSMAKGRIFKVRDIVGLTKSRSIYGVSAIKPHKILTLIKKEHPKISVGTINPCCEVPLSEIGVASVPPGIYTATTDTRKVFEDAIDAYMKNGAESTVNKKEEEIKTKIKEEEMPTIKMTEGRPQPKTLEEVLRELFGAEAVTDLKDRPKFIAHVFNGNEDLVEIVAVESDEAGAALLKNNIKEFLDYTIITYKMKNKHQLHVPIVSEKA